MFKTIYLWVFMLFLGTLFSGCVSHDIPLNPQVQVTNVSHENDVDMSDIDENLTESEMMMTEEGEDTKMARIAFPVTEYYALEKYGKGTIKGSIYVTDLYENKVFGAGTRLYLNPVTSYSEQWYEESYLGGHKMQKADARLFNYLKFTASDSNGNFAFYGVPSGSYYLIGTVKCGTQCGFENEKSIRIATRVSVQGNQVVTKHLTRPLN